jgi:hypothetical protein
VCGFPVGADASPAVNPPYVHSLAYNPTSTLLAAALGDGSVALHNLDSGNCVLRAYLHTAAVTHVEFARFPELFVRGVGGRRAAVLSGVRGAASGLPEAASVALHACVLSCVPPVLGFLWSTRRRAVCGRRACHVWQRWHGPFGGHPAL